MKPQVYIKIFLFGIISIQFANAQETFRDNFNSVSYSNNNGTKDFFGAWTESNETTNPSAGRILITSNKLRFRNLDNRRIQRSFDLSNVVSATLSFNFDRLGSTNERIRVELWNNATSSWQFTGNAPTTATSADSGTFTHTFTTDQISPASKIRLRTGSSIWGGSEVVTIDNLIITAVYPAAPVITATGNQQYCVGNTVAIVESITITDADDTTLSSAFIHIADGFIAGEDLLVLTGSHPGISPSWDAVDGKLTLTGVATLAAYEAAIAAVHYSSSGISPSGNRSFLITVGDLNVLPVTNHFYEFIPAIGISWTAARDEAATRSYFGVQGYLATLTSQAESDYANAQISGAGWIGANDAAVEGVWRWATGPEAGINFWNGLAGGSVVPGEFAFWNTSEPNNVGSGGEDYAHITDSAVGVSGSWNDLPNAGGGGVYQAKGYVVEYGGMVDDAVLSVFASTTVAISKCNVITNRRITYRVNND